jgi:hypothetical protein
MVQAEDSFHELTVFLRGLRYVYPKQPLLGFKSGSDLLFIEAEAATIGQRVRKQLE